MSIGLLIIIILVIVLIGVLPNWPHSQRYGYFPGGLVGIIVLVLLVLLITGRL